MPAAASAAGEVQAALGRLRAQGPRLRARPRAEVLGVLGAVLDELRTPGTRARRRLENELPAAAGFHPATVAEGLALGLAPLSGKALLDLAHAELGAEGAARAAHGFPVTAVLLAGAIPMPSVLALLAPLALRSPVLARPSARDPVTARVVVEALQGKDAELGAALEVASFPHGDAQAFDAFATAECVVATGTDETVAALRERTQPAQRFVGYGHRLSVAALGRSGDLALACREIARDVALWDQLGCLSPCALYALGWPWSERGKLLDELANAFAWSEKHWPLGQLDLAGAARRSAELATAELREGAGADVELRRGGGDAWALVAEREPGFRGSPLHRVLRVHFLEDAAAFATSLAPVRLHLAGLSVSGLGEADQRELAELGVGLGFSRICPAGTAQAPPLGWCHDGQGVLLPLARLVDRETR